ncbi:hypothetical protein Tco_0353692 [Tanacetum coccineum]
MKTKDTLSSCSDLDEQEIQQLQKQVKVLKENSLNKLNALKTKIQHLSSSNYSMHHEFRDSFHRLFDADEGTFKYVLSRNRQNLERHLNKETLHEKDSNYDLSVIKVQFDQFIHSKVARHEQELQNRLKRLNERKLQNKECKVQEVKASDASSGDKDNSGIVYDKGNDQCLENQSSTSRNESSRPSYDTEPMDEVPNTAEYNVFATDTQQYEQPESINDTYMEEKKANATLAQQLQECKSTLEETISSRDNCLIALQAKEI